MEPHPNAIDLEQLANEGESFQRTRSIGLECAIERPSAVKPAGMLGHPMVTVEHIEDRGGVRQQIAVIAGEQLLENGAGVLAVVAEDDVIAIGDEDEDVGCPVL